MIDYDDVVGEIDYLHEQAEELATRARKASPADAKALRLQATKFVRKAARLREQIEGRA